MIIDPTGRLSIRIITQTPVRAGARAHPARRVIAGWVCLALGVLAASSAIAQAARSISRQQRRSMLQDSSAQTLGSPRADVQIIEFFDYNCPYCKHLEPTLQQLVQEDAGAAVVYKDHPILGEISRYAARSALAAGWQGKYLAAHDALLGASRLTSHGQVDSILKDAGVDLPALQTDRASHAAQIEASLARIDRQARTLGFRGTPAMVIGRRVFPGSASLEDLRDMVGDARRGVRVIRPPK